MLRSDLLYRPVQIDRINRDSSTNSRNLLYHRRVNDGNTVRIAVLARQLFIKIIIRRCSVITCIMLYNKTGKTKIGIDKLMLKEMMNELGQLEELSQFSITGEMNTNQQYYQ